MNLDRRSWRVFLVALLVWCAGVAVPCFAQSLTWVLQSWGEPMARAQAGVDDACRQGSEVGWRFVKEQANGGGAELIVPAVLQPGQAYEFQVRVKAIGTNRPVVADVAFRRDGPYYETVAIRSATLVPNVWQTVVLQGRYTSLAPGSVRIGVRADGVGLCVGPPTLKPWAGADVSTTTYQVPKSFFGIHLNKLGRHTSWPGFDPDVVRMWATATSWTELQPTPDPIDWARNQYAQRLDFFVSHVRRQVGVHQVMMTLAMTPAWAGGAGDAGACAHSPFGARTCLAPADLSSWRLFVRALAERYKQSPIKIWEVWNEADVSTHWVGGAAKMVEMVRIVQEEVKAVSPDSVVIGPNVTSLGVRFLHDFLVAGGGRYIDGVSMHVYAGRSPARLFAQIRNLRALLQSHGLNLPIWNTEMNTACGGGPASDRLLEQAACVMSPEASLAQSLIGQAALGVANVSFYTWEGAELDVGGVGLVQSDFRTPTAAGLLYERLAGLLRGARLTWAQPRVAGLTEVAWSRSGQDCRLMWTDGPAEVTMPPSLLGGLKWFVQVNGKAVPPASTGGWRVSAMPVLACSAPVEW